VSEANAGRGVSSPILSKNKKAPEGRATATAPGPNLNFISAKLIQLPRPPNRPRRRSGSRCRSRRRRHLRRGRSRHRHGRLNTHWRRSTRRIRRKLYNRRRVVRSRADKLAACFNGFYVAGFLLLNVFLLPDRTPARHAARRPLLFCIRFGNAELIRRRRFMLHRAAGIPAATQHHHAQQSQESSHRIVPHIAGARPAPYQGSAFFRAK